MDHECEACEGKRYLVCTRDDGHQAVERCDLCWDGGDFDDEDAVKLAWADGIACRGEYPCYVGTPEQYAGAVAAYEAEMARVRAHYHGEAS